MKKTRITAAFLSALTAASMLSTSASALWSTSYKNPDKAIIDAEATVAGEVVNISQGLNGVNGSFFVNGDGEAVTGKKIVYTDLSGEYDIGFKMRMLRLDTKTGRVTQLLTGFVKNKTGRRYYCEGRRIYGWYKIGSYWYHFDENGYADTGKTKICGAYYTFDKKGRWTGKVSKSGTAPKDFKLEFISGNESGFSTDGKITYVPNSAGIKRTVQEKFSARDRQVMYCMFLESGMTPGEKYVSDDGSDSSTSDIAMGIYGEKTNSDDLMTVRITTGGKTTEIVYSPDDEGNAYFDAECLEAYIISENLSDYMTNCLFKKYPGR